MLSTELKFEEKLWPPQPGRFISSNKTVCLGRVTVFHLNHPALPFMREISLITGQLHRAIYNLNAEARREADQKFQDGLPSAPQRSLKKVFDQFSESLAAGEVPVRQRTASLLAKLLRTYEALPQFAQQHTILLVQSGLADPHPLVREATVESYCQLLTDAKLEDFDGLQFDEASVADAAADTETTEPGEVLNSRAACLVGLLEIAVGDVDEIVREAAAIGLGVQRSETIQKLATEFLLSNTTHLKYRRACRAIESLAEFPNQRLHFETDLINLLNDSNERYRGAALRCCLRLAKLGAVSPKLLAVVVRRMFDAVPEVSGLADQVARTCYQSLRRTNEELAKLLPICSRVAAAPSGRSDNLQKLIGNPLFQSHELECRQLCIDRILWQNELKPDLFNQTIAKGDLKQRSSAELFDELDRSDPASPRRSSEFGWAVSKCFELLAGDCAADQAE